MLYALRKLIAFVFLGGMFWFVYQDLDNLDKPWFMHALGLIVISFAFFWLLIPMVVVWFRIRRRVAQNHERYAEWIAAGGAAAVCERPSSRNARLPLERGEQALFHEKGTLYIGSGAEEFSSAAVLDRPVGRPSDVAFPKWRSKCRVVQRTHCYFTNRRVVFAGRGLDVSIPFSGLSSVSTAPGGIVFETLRGGAAAKFAFTFRNPLISADVLKFATGADVISAKAIPESAKEQKLREGGK